MMETRHFHLIMEQISQSSILNSPFFSVFAWMGLLLAFGTLLAEYSIQDPSQKQSPMRLTTWRKWNWSLLLLFILLVIISH